jgi:hypothetical protein
MSLVIDAQFRQPLQPGRNSSLGADTMARGVVTTVSSRLQMDHTSKVTLQILLAAMTLLGLLAFLLVDLRGTLPRKPTTIASTLAFLAASDLCCAQDHHLLPARAEWLDEKALERVFHGWLFSLGWWPAHQKQHDQDADVADGAAGFMRTPGVGKDDSSRTGRFGVDVGRPEQLGYRPTRWRKARGPGGGQWT